MRLIHTERLVCKKYIAKERMLEVYMEGKKNNLDVSVLTREYSNELERSIAVRNYLKEGRDGIQADNAQRSGISQRNKV